MSIPEQSRMSADAFLAWVTTSATEQRYELISGHPVAMAPERLEHALVKFAVTQALAAGVRAGDLPCTVFPDGVAVKVDDETVYEPDASLRCGSPLDGKDAFISDPLIVVEVLSPSTAAKDIGSKLQHYFRLSSVQHYLVVNIDTKTIIHHRRSADAIETHLASDGELLLTPPGLRLKVAACFASLTRSP
ncbi:MAG: Uma2 family endonuclease [Myxococcota bacterium]